MTDILVGPGASHSYDVDRGALCQAALDEIGLPSTYVDELAQLVQSTIDDFLVQTTGYNPIILGNPG